MAAGPVAIRTIAARPTAVVAQTTTWSEFPRLWRALLDEVYACIRDADAPAGTHEGARWRNVMLYKDDRPAVEIGVLARAAFQPRGRVIGSRLPAGRVAIAVHGGAYAQLGDTHATVAAYARAQRLQLAGPRWEIYGHWHEDEEKLETEVYLLLR